MVPPTSIDTDRIEAVILAFIRDELAAGETVEVDPEDNLLTSGLVDSVAILRLIAHAEQDLGVTVPPTDMVPENFRSARVMAAYLASLLPDG